MSRGSRKRQTRKNPRGGSTAVVHRAPRRLNSGPIHTFKRTIFQPAKYSVTTSNVYASISFNLNDLPNVAEFTSLFDQYRINSIKWTLMPRGSSAEAGTNNSACKIFSVLDYDDDTAPTSIDTLLQYENCKTSNSLRDHSRSLRPKFARSVYQSALVTGYGQSSGWLDCDSTLIPHYGIKLAFQGTAGAQIFDVRIQYSVSFMGVR